MGAEGGGVTVSASVKAHLSAGAVDSEVSWYVSAFYITLHLQIQFNIILSNVHTAGKNDPNQPFGTYLGLYW